MSRTSASIHRIGNYNLTGWFLNSASVLLLTFALAIGLCNLANSGLTPPQDPLFGCSLRVVFWIVSALFAIGSLVCLGVGSQLSRAALVAWLAFSFQAYQLGLFFLSSHALHGWFGYFSPVFGVPSRMLEMFAHGAFLYLLVVGLLFVARFWLGEKKTERLAKQVASSKMLKCHCQACGGRVLFSAANLGQKTPCPHCQTNITLSNPDVNLKTSCFFCKGHIEFPAHATGQKLKCPHCKNDITLKEPV